MAPNVRGGCGLVVPRCIEARFKDIFGKHAILGQAIDAFADIEVYPTVMDILEQVISLDKLFRDVREFYASVFRVGEMGLEVIFKFQCY